ncbi:MAG: hypothetical protein QOJ69_1115 [Actinomycetota bacterium]|jgi:hypothetical protein|nr:hypothetical protein [Actinomycetota bacterium]
MGRLRLVKRWQVVAAGVAAVVVAGAIVAAVTNDTSGEATLAVGEPARDSVATPAPAPLAFPSPSGAGGNASIAIGDESGQKQVDIGPVPPSTVPGAVVPGALKIVRTGELRVNVGKNGFGAAFDRVASIAAAHGGFVASSSTSMVDKARAGELTVRVPADKFDAARRDLGALGTVESQSLRGEDVSAQLVDYDARLKSLNAQEEALRGLLGKATAVGEVLQVQNSLFDVRQQIEQLQAQRANLEQAASLATLQVSLFEPGAAFQPQPTEPEKGLAGAFGRAVDAAESVVGGIIVVIGWLTPLVLIGLVAWGVSRLFRNRSRRAKTRPAPAEAPATS